MKLLKFTSISSRLTYWFLILTLFPLLIILLIAYFQRVTVIQTATFDKLTAIRDLKAQQINEWLDERNGDLLVASGDFEIRSLEKIFEKETYSSQDLVKISTAEELCKRLARNLKDYKEVFFIDASTALVEISSNRDNLKMNKTNEPYFSVPLEKGEIYINDINKSSSGELELTYSAPVFCMSHNKHIIGVLVFSLNLESSLYALLQNRVGLGKTGETLIVDDNLFALNELLWHENAPLNLKIQAEPAVNASKGLTGIIAAKDYRGVNVLSAYTYIHDTGWGFVCKQDLYELNEPIRQLVLNFILIFLITAIVITFIALSISRSFVKPILQMNKISKKLSSGDFSEKNTIISEDEIGSLGLAFNDMADAVQSRLQIQEGISMVSEVMIGRESIKDFGQKLLKLLMKISNSNIASFYILNEVSMEYEYFTSIGAHEKMLGSFSAETAEGEFGIAISEKNICHLKDIPATSIQKYKTTVGDISPKEIITIPIIVENSIVALISLASIQKFDQASIDILKHSFNLINTSYSNILASERTRILADQLTRFNQQLEAQTEELQEQSEELQNQTDELHRTTDELQEQNVELEAQRKQVETANKMKSEFLSNMSHELRTPLNSIMALSRVLITQANKKLNKEENSYLEIVERNGKKLLSLINDILDLSKIEAGKMEIIPEFISLKSIVNIVKENLQSLSNEKGIELTLSVADDLPQIETEETKLHQILTNIVGNAVKFTEKGGVDINVTNDSDSVYIEIKDSGIGITSEELPHIFDEFRQADGSSSRPYEGTGLGLAIAHKMTTILGGKITVRSKLGEGTTFTISMPIKWHEDILIANKYSFEDKLSPSMAKTILVVDDDPKTIKGISEYLNEAGYKTIVANSGVEALELAERYQPFAITMDIIMPDMDGWEALQKLKINPKTKDIPVIIISVSDDKETGSALGAIGFINKPINKNTLIKEVNKIKASPETIMIVDDNEFEVKQMSKILEDENIKTIIARSGSQCMELLDDKIPDILVLDLMMPEMDGFEVLQKIRAKTETRNMPVIVVSAKELTSEDESKLKGNVSSIIAKSDTTAEDLYQEIKRIIEGWKKTQDIADTIDRKHKNRILLVEDNLEAIVQVKSVLENEKYIIDVAEGGQEALDFVQHTIPDGIILDLMMPDVDGFAVLEKLRGTEKTKNIPVLILTAKDLSREDMSILSANNVQQLIHKGDVDIKGLLHKVKLMLGSQAMIESITDSNSEFRTPNVSKNKLKKKEELRQKRNLPNILVVEDNPDNMITIKAILGDMYKITEAFDGEVGLRTIQSQLPDLILLDMSLPKMSGEEIIDIIKKDNETKHIPVIAVTAQAMKGDEEKFIEAGCDGYISKPIDSVLLLSKIKDVLRN